MQIKPINKWAVGVITADRPTSTLDQTLRSLSRAGWPEYHVFEDLDRNGVWPNWIGMLRSLVERYPRADAYLIVQDDAVFCRRLREYLENTLWPENETALCSPYCPTPYMTPNGGWHQENRGWYLIGAVCWVIHPESARAMLTELEQVESRAHVDSLVGQWAATAGQSVWYHTPSLIQHTGCGNSALGDPSISEIRRAADFIGEDAVPYNS